MTMALKGKDGCVDGGGGSSSDNGSVDDGGWCQAEAAEHNQNLLSPLTFSNVLLTSGALETLGGKKIIKWEQLGPRSFIFLNL